MKNITDLFGNREEQYLEEVIIVPVGSSLGLNSTITLPAGTIWSDFERIELQGRYSPDPVVVTRGSESYIGEQFVIGASFILAMSTATDVIQVGCIVTGNTSATIHTATNAVLSSVRGYRKRYATKNLSKTINVNGGAHVAVSSRYEIDIATELGVEYLDRELIVIAEVYNTIDGIVGWGAPGWIFEAGAGGYGLVANKVGNKIVVQTGNVRVMDSSINTGNPFGTSSSVSSIQCRVQVWKIDQYITVGVNDA